MKKKFLKYLRKENQNNMDFNDKVITLGNGKSYLVIDTVIYENKTYAYLVNKFDELDSMFREISSMGLNEIDKDLFSQKIYPLFIEKFSNY